MLTRNSRQERLVGAEAQGADVMVCGAGAVGRQVVMMLAAMGLKKVRVFDPDSVEVHNVASQGYRPRDVGRDKVGVVLDGAGEMFSDEGEDWWGGVRKVMKGDVRKGSVVLLCVDSMAAREQIWRWACEAGARVVVDGRMSGEVLRVLREDRVRHGAPYERTLFADGEAFQEGCTRQSTIYVASVTAALMVQAFVMAMAGREGAVDVMMDLGELGDLETKGGFEDAVATGHPSAAVEEMGRGRSCGNCRYCERSVGEEPCRACVAEDLVSDGENSCVRWERGEEDEEDWEQAEEDEEDRGCGTCRFADVAGSSEPCRSCVANGGSMVRWERGEVDDGE